MSDQLLTSGETTAGILEKVPDSVLLPYQQRWIADTSEVKIIEKSRRIGLSWAEAADAALYASQTSGASVYYLAYNQDMTQSFIRDVAFWARFYNLAAGEVEEVVLRDDDRDVKIFQVRFASGHLVQALSSHPRNLRSKGAPGERVVLDEFAFHDSQDELLKAAMAFLMWGGQVRILSTHNGVDNGFNQVIQEVREGKKPYSLHRVTLDDALEEGLFERISLVRGIEWTLEAESKWRDDLIAFYGHGSDEELFCIPSQSGGRYISRLLVEESMNPRSPVLKLELSDDFAMKPEAVREAIIDEWLEDNIKPHLALLDKHLQSVYGFDFGRTGDLSVMLPAQIGRDLVRRCPFAIEMRNVPHTSQMQVVLYVGTRLPRFVAAAHDARGNGSYVAERAAQLFGFERVHQIMATDAWYMEAFPRYKAAFEDHDVELPKSADLLNDHSAVVLVRGVPKLDKDATRGTDGRPRHGDGAIAGVMMWWASLHPGAPIEFETLGRRASLEAMTQMLGSGGPEIDTDHGFGRVRGSTHLMGY